MLRRLDRDDVWAKAPALRAALTKAWPTQQPIRLVDRLLKEMVRRTRPASAGRGPSPTSTSSTRPHSLLDGTPFTYGHVVVDEAQDHSAVALRVIGRRSPSGSMTILGDLAQSTTPAGQQDWDVALAAPARGDGPSHVAHLTIGYRVPGPILDVANRLLPFTGVASEASRSVRTGGEPPVERVVATRATGRRRRRRGARRAPPSPQHRCRRRAGALRRAARRARRRSACTPSTGCTTWRTTTCRCSARRR